MGNAENLLLKADNEYSTNLLLVPVVPGKPMKAISANGLIFRMEVVDKEWTYCIDRDF